MSEKLQRLVYYSRNRLTGSPEENAAAIRTILASSRRNNADANVTGALMFNAGCFAQVLEGPRNAVEQVFERIQQDPRHGDVSLLGFDPVPARSFENWAMAFAGASIDDATRYGTIAGETSFDPARMTSDALFETLHRLVLEDERYGRATRKELGNNARIAKSSASLVEVLPTSII